MENSDTAIPFGSHFNRSGPPMGIYVLSGLFALGAVSCAVVFFAVPRPLRLVIGSLGPLCLLLSFGMAFRNNVARLMLILLLVIGLILDTILVFNPILRDVPSRLPVFPTVARISLTVWTLAYLLRKDVRAAFLSREEPVGHAGPQASHEHNQPGPVVGNAHAEQATET